MKGLTFSPILAIKIESPTHIIIILYIIFFLSNFPHSKHTLNWTKNSK